MQQENNLQHVFLVGAKSLGAYGGYETFVYKLTEYHQNKKNIKYHVACKANGDGCMDETKVDGATRINDHEFEFHNAHCFKIDIPQIGPAQAIYYDVVALKTCCKYIKEHRIKHPIVYIMACRIGPFAGHFYKEIHKLGGTVYLNPDGHEWMRAKWSAPIRKYWKISEQMMVKYCDLAICDSVNIEKYIHECYDGKGIKGKNPKTTFIAYGADLTLSKLADDDEKLVNWYKEKGLTKKGYYLVVGRFVPENSFEVMIREFMKSKSQKDFAIITNINDKFLNELEEKLHFKRDKRIKFVGTVYDQELLKKIRENAYAYFHYAFADQDDVWKPNKLIRCIDAMRGGEQVPQLAYCKMQRSDIQLKRLDEQVEILKPEQLTKKLTLVKTYNYGAATVINKSAKNLVCRLWPEVDDLPHDMWIGTLCYWFGRVYYVDEELYYWIRYETSVTGEGTKETAIRYRLKKTVQKKSYPNISTAILDGYGDLLRPEDRDFLKRINDYKVNWKDKVTLILDPTFKRLSFCGTIALKLGILMNWY